MLNEVFTGGLSSYSIVNMVMTHLLCMGYQLTDLSGPIGPGPGFWGSLVPAREQPEEDLGELLLSFFAHFGSNFDYSRHAVSVGQVHLFCYCPCMLVLLLLPLLFFFLLPVLLLLLLCFFLLFSSLLPCFSLLCTFSLPVLCSAH